MLGASAIERASYTCKTTLAVRPDDNPLADGITCPTFPQANHAQERSVRHANSPLCRPRASAIVAKYWVRRLPLAKAPHWPCERPLARSKLEWNTVVSRVGRALLRVAISVQHTR